MCLVVFSDMEFDAAIDVNPYNYNQAIQDDISEDDDNEDDNQSADDVTTKPHPWTTMHQHITNKFQAEILSRRTKKQDDICIRPELEFQEIFSFFRYFENLKSLFPGCRVSQGPENCLLEPEGQPQPANPGKGDGECRPSLRLLRRTTQELFGGKLGRLFAEGTNDAGNQWAAVPTTRSGVNGDISITNHVANTTFQ